jgi:plastocyanin
MRLTFALFACAAACCGGSYHGNTRHGATSGSGDEWGLGSGSSGSDYQYGARPAPTEKGHGPVVAKGPSTPTRQKADAFKSAADLLEQAQTALDNQNKDLAEMLFSSAEILTGPEAVAAIAPLYREGAPPRVTAPTVKVEDKGKQPETAGSSEEDEPAAKPQPQLGAIDGEMKIDGKAAAGAIGFVTLTPVGKGGGSRAPKQRIMEQRDRQFAPHVLAVPVGSTVTFPNFDSIYHNVFSRSEAANFDLGLYKQGDARAVTFEKEGIVRVGCNLHANMSAFIVVVAAPHYAITDTGGHFQFKNLSPGKYTLHAWSEKSKSPITQEVTVKVGDNKVEVGVAGDAPSGPQPDKFGAPRVGGS